MIVAPDPALGDAILAVRPLCVRPAAAVIMGIVNATPDSFSDGGRFSTRPLLSRRRGNW